RLNWSASGFWVTRPIIPREGPVPTAANNHGAPDMLRELGAWAGDFHSPGVASGGLPPVPYNSLTLDPCATRAYVRGALGDLIYIDQGAVSVGPLNQGNGTYYLAIHRSASSLTPAWKPSGGWPDNTCRWDAVPLGADGESAGRSG